MKVFIRFGTPLVVSAVVFLAIAAAPAAKTGAKDEVILFSQMKFEPAPIPGVSKATVWGDPAKGPYGSITRFAKGTKVDGTRIQMTSKRS